MPFNTLADDLQRLVDATDAIGQAIIDAGGTVNEYDRLEEYPADIMSINRNTTSIDITENGQYYAGEENTITTTEFPITIQNSVGTPMKHVTVDGNMQQNGTPTPQNPIQPNETGDKTGNLFDISTLENGIYLAANGNKYGGVSDGVRSGTKIKALPNTTYTFSAQSSANVSLRILEWSNGTFTNQKPIYNISGSISLTVTTTAETTEIAFNIEGANGQYATNIMLNTGDTALPYEPYGYKMPISSAGHVAPVYLGEVQSTRQIKKWVLTGEEEWLSLSTDGTRHYLPEISPDYMRMYNAITYRCSHYSAYPQTVSATFVPNLQMAMAYSTTAQRLYITDPNHTTDTDFKTYLAQQYANGTPVTVWYVLAEPTTGIVNEPLRKIGDYVDTVSADITLPLSSTEPNIVDVNTSLKPSSASFTYNKKNDYIGYNEINVDVPNTYTVEDEGKVVNNASLVAQTAMPDEITANDTYDTTLYNSITVNIPLSIGPKDVTFYDYDGSVVYTYTKDEFLALTELPTNPTHEGLTAQGWNWSLADAKTYVNKYGKLNIGQMYVTSDGKTRIYITLTEGRTSPILQLYLNDNSELDIDWGDGGSHSTFTTTSAGYKSERHSYATAGDYVIAITVTNGSFALQSTSSNVSSILWNGNDNTSSPDRAYNNSIKKIEIGSGVGIGTKAFKYCSSLSSITIPESVTSISSYAFQNCQSLSSITIPNRVTSIDQNTFNGCSSLTSITIGNSVTSISSYAFYQCSSLSSITIPDTVTTINNRAFYGCYALSSITIPDTVTYANIGIYAFTNCQSLSSVIIGNSVTSISSYAFQNCQSLSSITIPNRVTSIDQNTFNGCSSLTSITIGNSVTSIDNFAFQNCKSLSSVIIGNSVTSIGNFVFDGCSYMESIKLKPTTPPTVSNSNAWTGIPTSCIILVPINTYSAYTTATNYPDPSTYTYLAFGTYESGTTLPSTTTDNYMLIWYASAADAIAQTNPITTGNGNEVYARCLVDTSVTRSIDFDNNTSTLSGDPSTHPTYTSIKRCTVQDDGTITSYYGDANYIEDGSIGQVMVYIPKFYYKVNITNKQLIDDTHPEYGYDIHESSYSVSNIKYQGYKLHPAFVNANGDEVDYVLCSAFEGSTYDTSASAYNTNDAQTVDFTANTGDLLASIGYVDNSGTTVHVKPASGLTQNFTRPNSMKIAKNRGAGWYALTFKLASAIQMLITVEYGCNSQVNIANGVVGITDNSAYNCASYVGSTVGNTSGRAASTINEINGTETTYTSSTTTSVNYRGIENMWGNIWKWVDGINIYGNGSQRGGVPYVCTDMNFSDTNTDNYESVGFTVANTDGYVKYFGWGNDKYDWVFMPSTAGSGGASASTTVGDYFYRTTNLNGYRAARLGGYWYNSSFAGVFYWTLDYAASYRSRNFGARLMYVPM